MTSSHSSGVMSMKWCRMLIPALLISTSRPSMADTACSTAPFTWSRSVTSARMMEDSPGSSSPIRSSAAGSRSSTATQAPSSRKRAAVAAPIPLAPPVTSTRISNSPPRKRAYIVLFFPVAL